MTIAKLAAFFFHAATQRGRGEFLTGGLVDLRLVDLILFRKVRSVLFPHGDAVMEWRA